MTTVAPVRFHTPYVAGGRVTVKAQAPVARMRAALNKKYSGAERDNMMLMSVGLSCGLVFVAMPWMVNAITDSRNAARVHGTAEMTRDDFQRVVMERRLELREKIDRSMENPSSAQAAEPHTESTLAPKPDSK